MNAECHLQDLAAAYVTGDLPIDERREFEKHLVQCATCCASLESTRAIIHRLRSVPDEQASEDLASVIWTRLQEPRRKAISPPSWLPRAAAAALLAVFTGGALWASLRGVAPEPTAVAMTSDSQKALGFRRALDWFCQTQEPDGSWDAERWGGNRRFAVALTALPTIALLESGETRHQKAASSAIEFLHKQQQPDGTFGERVRETPYVQSVTTFALLRAYQKKPEPVLKTTLDAALRVVFQSQTADGGWGYDSQSISNEAITRWHMEVVELASALGWKEANPILARAGHWIATHSSSVDLGAVSIHRLSTDYHHAYFIAASLRHDASEDARQQLTAIRHDIIAAQSSSGEVSGTWQPTDQWSRVGGRLYSTALASLTLL